MKYVEIVGLQDYFQPVYDLEHEEGVYWKQFIPNEKFRKVLSETVNSLESNRAEDRKSIWLYGAYGTGKSHATAVIKHLLFDDLDSVDGFIENLDDQLKFKIRKFREKHRAFPVVLKGISSITDNRTFALVLERAVRLALEKEGVEVTTKTDFDRMIAKLRSDDVNWEKILKGTELEVYGTKDDLIDMLQKKDVNILAKIENVLSQRGIHFSVDDIVVWLEEVRNELKDNGIADYLVIYWDEFTSVLGSSNSGQLLTLLQGIAELSVSRGVYLFVVAHRTYDAKASREDVEKVLGRFKVLDYSMEPLTTYQILSAAIQKKDPHKFEEVKKKHIGSVGSIISKIIGSEGTQARRSLEKLFPIHPYAAYLATFIARNIGSTERSIFNFLYDEQKGFKKFITENPGKDGNIFLTADRLWDFFYGEFERIESEKFSVVLEKYKANVDNLEKNGELYLSVFKGILLLNFLYRFVEEGRESLVTPSDENILNLFAGEIERDDVERILTYLDDNQIISKKPNGLYLITSTGLPLREVAAEKNKIAGEYHTVERILTDKQKKELQDVVCNSVNRPVDLVLLDANTNEHLIRRKIENAFKKDYSIHVCLFLGRNEGELQRIRRVLKNMGNHDEMGNVIFAVSHVALNCGNSNRFDKFIEYKARARVADMHNYPEERTANENWAIAIIDDWINQVKSGYIDWFLQGESGTGLMVEFWRKINDDISRKIFVYGLENISGAKRNRNVWTYKRSKASIEAFLFAKDRSDFEHKTSKGIERYLREIIKDNNGEYIVDVDLRIKEDVPETHPIKRMYLDLKEKIADKKDVGVFNLGEALGFLTKPPYGLYPSMCGMAAMGFLMREYVGKLFEAGTGTPIQKDIMRDKILDLFDYWEGRTHRGKLDVRLGTEEEERLLRVLKDLFKLEDVKSLNDARWKVREWIKTQGFPIWVFKLSENANERTKKAIDSIFEIVQSVDTELTYEKIKYYLDIVESVVYDLEILLNRENAGELFQKWLESIENVEIAPEEVDNVVDYIQRNMQEEVASWRESKVRETVMGWYVKKLKLKQEQYEKQARELVESTVIPKDSHDGPYADDTIGLNGDNYVSGGRIKRITERISEIPAQDAKDILMRLVWDLKDTRPDVIATIEKYLGEIDG